MRPAAGRVHVRALTGAPASALQLASGSGIRACFFYTLLNSGRGVQVTPSWGWILIYEYTLTFFALFYGKFLHIAWRSARAHASLPVHGTKVRRP